MFFRKRISEKNQFQKLFDEIHSKLDVKVHYNNQERVFNRVMDQIHNPLEEESGERFKKRIKALRVKQIVYATSIAASILLFLYISGIKSFNESQPDINNTNLSHYTVKENKSGQKSLVHLSDGTRVWLNSQSKITFPEVFVDSQRVVELIGEAYFEVAKNTTQPFIVKAKTVNVKALGTAFNINAFDDNSGIVVSLIEGKVAVSTVYNKENLKVLEPGWVANIKNNGSNIDTFKADVESMILWKDGILVFNNDDFIKVINTLERWYGVKIEVYGDIDKSYNFKGIFKNEYLTNILTSMQHSKSFEYRIEGDLVKIFLN